MALSGNKSFNKITFIHSKVLSTVFFLSLRNISWLSLIHLDTLNFIDLLISPKAIAVISFEDFKDLLKRYFFDYSFEPLLLDKESKIKRS